MSTKEEGPPSYEFGFGRQEHLGHIISAWANRREGAQAWFVDVQIETPDGETLIRRQYVSAGPLPDDAVAFGLRSGRALLDMRGI